MILPKTLTKLFVQIGKGVQLADAENIPFTNLKIIPKVYLLVLKNWTMQQIMKSLGPPYSSRKDLA